MWEQTRRIGVQLMQKRQSGISPDALKSGLRALADIALEEKAYNTALTSLIELDDKNRVRELSALCLQEGWLNDALIGYDFLCDNEGRYKVIFAAINKQNMPLLEMAMECYFTAATGRTINDWFIEWEKQHDLPGAVVFNNAPVANMAYNLAPRYDLAIGIAKGGLYSAFLFETFGLETRIAESHKCGRGADFRWITQPAPEEIKGRRIIVLDKDTVKGRTTSRVLREIQKYEPAYVDLSLIHPPLKPGQMGIGSVVANINPDYRQVHFPGDFGYHHFDVAIQRLQEAFGAG